MSDITRKDILHVARLARLQFSDEEIDRFTGHMSSMLDYVAQLQEVDVEGVEPTSHALPMKNVLRDDVIVPSMTPEEILANAPRQDNNCYKVPAVIPQGSA